MKTYGPLFVPGFAYDLARHHERQMLRHRRRMLAYQNMGLTEDEAMQETVTGRTASWSLETLEDFASWSRLTADKASSVSDALANVARTFKEAAPALRKTLVPKPLVGVKFRVCLAAVILHHQGHG